MNVPENVRKTISDSTNMVIHYRTVNKIKDDYVDGENRVKNLRMFMPKHFENLSVASAWPQVVIERKTNRCNLLGFTAPKHLQDEVNAIVNSNDLTGIIGQIMARNAFTYGTTYGFVSYGDPSKEEPEFLITAENSANCYGNLSHRSRKLDDLLQVSFGEDGHPSQGIFHTREATYYFDYDTKGNSFHIPGADVMPLVQKVWEIYIRKVDNHNQGYIDGDMFRNRPSSSRPHGQSELSKAIRDHTDQCVTTYVQSALAREVYATPQRYILNIDADGIKDKDGNQKSGFSAYFNKMFVVTAGKNSKDPVVGQFPASSPEPMLALLKSYGGMISAATGIPLNQLGFMSEANPASADAIVANSEVAIKAAEDSMQSLGSSWVNLIKIILRKKNNGVMPEGADEIRAVWRSAASPTKAADADAAVKLVSAKILPADSIVTYRRLDLSDSEIQTLISEKEALQAKTVTPPVEKIVEKVSESE